MLEITPVTFAFPDIKCKRNKFKDQIQARAIDDEAAVLAYVKQPLSSAEVQTSISKITH